MSPDPAGRRSRPGPARGVATVRPAVPPPEPAGTVYTGGFHHAGYRAGEVRPSVVARLVLAGACMLTGMVGGGLLAGQAVASWLGV